VAGQQVKLIVSDSAFDTGNFVASATVSIVDSLETTVISQTVHVPGDEIDTDPLSDTRTHTLMVNPRQIRTGSLTLTLSDVGA
jgi:hypothetical protein